MIEWLKIQLIQLGLHNIPRPINAGGRVDAVEFIPQWARPRCAGINKAKV